jgi:hypothetical protein
MMTQFKLNQIIVSTFILMGLFGSAQAQVWNTSPYNRPVAPNNLCQRGQALAPQVFAQNYNLFLSRPYGRSQAVYNFVQNNCLLTSEVYQLATLFHSNNDRVRFLYFAFNHTLDQQNYASLANLIRNRQDQMAFLNFAGQYTNQYNRPNNGGHHNQGSQYQQPVLTPAPIVYLPNYSGHCGCQTPLLENEANQIIQTLQAAYSDSERSSMANQAIKNRCLTTDQVRRIVRLFFSENAKLAFAKFAWAYTYDIDNYYLVNQELFSQISKSTLSSYTQQTPHTTVYPNPLTVVAPNNNPSYPNNNNPYPNNTNPSYPNNNNPYPNNTNPSYPNNNNPYPNNNNPSYPNNNNPYPNNNNPSYPNNNTNQSVPCQPASQQDYNLALETIKAKGFDNSRLDFAKQIVSAKCFTSEQIKAMAYTFDFDNNRLDFAKYAYDFVLDPSNYYLVSTVFEFDSNSTILTNYIKGKR